MEASEASPGDLPLELQHELELEEYRDALTYCRTALMKIINVRPEQFIKAPGAKPAVVQAYSRRGRYAEEALIGLSDRDPENARR